MKKLAEGIRLVFPPQPLEHIRLGISKVLEAAQSWHVLTDPSHHALHLPWVRACRQLPAGLRQQLRDQSFAVRAYLPSFLEAGIAHPDFSIEEEIALIRAVPAQELLPELVLTLLDWPRESDFSDPAVQGRIVGAVSDQHAAARLRQIFTDPERVRDQVLTVLSDYWHASFAAEFERLEPGLHQAMEDAARQLAAAGPLGLLSRLIPEVVLDPVSSSVLIPRPHHHEVAIAEHGGIVLVPSVYAWPHVRVTCDHPPWPLGLIFPVDPLIRPLAPPLAAEEMTRQLRALAAGSRLELLRLTAAEPRSTQELARLTQLSEAAVSKHLQTLHGAGLLSRSREGYYVLYAADKAKISAFVQALGQELNAILPGI